MEPTIWESVRGSIASPEFRYAALILALFVFPRFLIRFGVPLALTAFFLGITFSWSGSPFAGDATLQLLATLGIVSLFLFAGIEVDFAALRGHRKILIQHLAVSVLTLLGAAFVLVKALGLDVRPGALLALALLTPSAGFILDSIDNSKLGEKSKSWIRTKAIAAEIVALAALFFLVRSGSVLELIVSVVIMAALILLLPIIFRAFAKKIAPFAPKSEFGFLLITAILASMITRKLGAYYLVGAFVVGIAARKFEEAIPELTSKTLVRSLRFFAGFFTPFYFFRAGMHVQVSDFTWRAVLLGLAFLVVFIPLRIGLVMLHRRVALGEALRDSLPIASSLVPTLVFGLVLAGLLKNQFQVSPDIFGAVVLYTIGATLLPAFVFRYIHKSPEYAAVAASNVELDLEDISSTEISREPRA